MQTLWFSNLNKADQEDFQRLVLGSQKVLDRLTEIVYNKVSSDESVKTVDYDSASWAYRQAHVNGRKEAFNEILKLLELRQEQ